MIYLDSSALVKLVLAERPRDELVRWVGERRDRVSSVITSIELRRAVRRAMSVEPSPARRRELLRTADAVLEQVSLLALDDAIVARASALDPPALRALDAVHVASALAVEPLEGLVTYDARLAAAATAAGLVVFSPGA